MLHGITVSIPKNQISRSENSCIFNLLDDEVKVDDEVNYWRKVWPGWLF
jgi:hypothetical protein